jgi:hypothetical protein
VAWLPALALLGYERSPLVAMVLPLAVVNAALFLRPARVEEVSEPGDWVRAAMFEGQAIASRGIVSAAVVAVALQGGAFLVALGRVWGAAVLLAMGCGVAAWRIAGVRGRKTAPSFVWRTLLAVLVTGVALVPFLRGGAAIPGFGGPRLREASWPGRSKSLNEGGQYTGVVLVAPVKRHPVVLPPKTEDAGVLSRTLAKPLEIDFDGAYWYFKEPDARPAADAKVVKGDPLKAHYRSTNARPLTMEAHQPLSPPLKFDCCREIRVRLVNGEKLPGVIAIELRLENSVTKESVSLGLRVLPSSVGEDFPVDRVPVHETLTFPARAVARAGVFDEIMVSIRPSVGRAVVGSRVGVEGFVLVP